MDQKKYIIVAEDDKFYTNIYKVKLTNLGYDVTVASDGSKIVDEAKKRRPDLILLDMIMPGVDGFQAIKLIKAEPELKDIPIIILSSLSQEEDKQKALQLGANEYYVKSNISINDVTTLVGKYLK